MGREVWADGTAYEGYIGRWSRLAAPRFLGWLEPPPDARWLDVGSGTGAVVETILSQCSPKSIIGVDSSQGYVTYARSHVDDPRARFELGTATALPIEDDMVDVAVSGLVLNFVPEPERAAAEMARVTRPDGLVGLYVWDYGGEMQLIRRFWDAAAELDPAARELDEDVRFLICRPDPLRALFTGAGLVDVQVEAIDVPTRFQDFDDYWAPFLGGQGPAPGYAMSLDEERRTTLRERLRARLPTEPDGSIELIARAWAVRGRRAPAGDG
jgi:SAM-dependent methyltransferase